MKFFILSAILAAAAVGAVPYGYKEEPKAVQEEPKYPTIMKQEDVRNLDGSSQYSYASSDQITRQESQYQKQIGSSTGNAAQGSSSYMAPDGQKISMSWVADENGYQPVGEHLPTPPPVPAEIAAMLPTLPKLSFEELYGGAAAAAPKPAYEAPKYETSKPAAPKYETPKYDVPKVETPKPEAPRYDVPKIKAPKYDAPKYKAPAPTAPVAPAAPAKPAYVRSY